MTAKKNLINHGKKRVKSQARLRTHAHTHQRLPECECARALTLCALVSSSLSRSYPFSRTSMTDGLRSREKLSFRAPQSPPSSADRKLPSDTSASAPCALDTPDGQFYIPVSASCLDAGAGRSPAIAGVCGCGVDGPRGEQVGPQPRGRRPQGVRAVQGRGRLAATGGGALLRLVLRPQRRLNHRLRFFHILISMQRSIIVLYIFVVFLFFCQPIRHVNLRKPTRRRRRWAARRGGRRYLQQVGRRGRGQVDLMEAFQRFGVTGSAAAGHGGCCCSGSSFTLIVGTEEEKGQREVTTQAASEDKARTSTWSSNHTKKNSTACHRHVDGFWLRSITMETSP